MREMIAPDKLCATEYVMRPGDVMVVSPGYWHAAVALDHSISLVLAFGQPSFTGLMRYIIEQSLERVPIWREPLPLSPELSEDWSSNLRTFIEERLDELRHEVLESDLQEFSSGWTPEG